MFEKIFGSSVDWLSQHSVFPEYFRQLFYSSGTLFPQFAMNIGGGQNLYNFAYYGLYNPLLLPALALPFIKMSDYLMAVSILCLAADLLLMFCWLRHNGISVRLCAGVSLLFLLAAPLIFHSYTHVMFVNYMPFLLGGLTGADRYFEKGKAGLLTLCIFLMIMTSFYFSIGGCLVLFLYGVYQYWGRLEEAGHATVPGVLKDGLRFCLPFLTGIFMSCFLLVPAAMALKSCPRQTHAALSTAELLLPDLKWSQLFYNPYGTGVTTVFLTMLLTGVTYKKPRDRVICLACLLLLLIPFFRFALNGGLYIRGKVLIPMLPLLCYLLALYLQKIKNRELSRLQLVLPALAVFVLLLPGCRQEEPGFRALLLTDAGLVAVCLILFFKKACETYLLCLSIGLLLLCGIQENILSGHMTDRSFYEKVTDQEAEHAVEKTLKQEKGFYRMEENGSAKENSANINRVLSPRQYLSSVYSSTYQGDYQTFRSQTFQLEQPCRNILCQAISENPIFRKLMGVRYILSDQAVPGYEKTEDHVYQNKDVYPVIYGAGQTLSQKDYLSMSFPLNQLAFLKYAVTDTPDSPEGWKTELAHSVKPVSIGFEEKQIHLSHQVSRTLSIPAAGKGDIFFLQFQVENQRPGQDVVIDLDGIRNKLSARSHLYYNGNTTFTYAAALEEGQTSLELCLGPGAYRLSDVKGFLYRDTLKPEYTSFKLNRKETKGNTITGSIEEKEDGYLITSIPYDQNFEIRIDGQKVKPEKVNTAFLGAELKKGRHHIVITYHAAGLKAGLLLSGAGWAFFLCLLLLHRKKPGCRP